MKRPVLPDECKDIIDQILTIADNDPERSAQILVLLSATFIAAVAPDLASRRSAASALSYSILVILDSLSQNES